MSSPKSKRIELVGDNYDHDGSGSGSGGALSALEDRSASITADSAKVVAAVAVPGEQSEAQEAASSSLTQQLMNSLRITAAAAAESTSSAIATAAANAAESTSTAFATAAANAATAAAGGQQSLPYLQLSSLASGVAGSGGGGSGGALASMTMGGDDNDNLAVMMEGGCGAGFPFVSLQQPTLIDSGGVVGGLGEDGSGTGTDVDGQGRESTARAPTADTTTTGSGMSGNNRYEQDGYQHFSTTTTNNNISPERFSKGIGLTRALSTPESKRSYLPFGGNDTHHHNHHLHHHNSKDILVQEEQLSNESNRDLSQAYPLLLQRSASSAFGSPCSSKVNKQQQVVGKSRSHSNSGSSDPGVSAFHPVWSCKSLSTDGSVSGSNVGSEVGSAVSSSVHSTGGAASLIRSTHSDPSYNKNKLGKATTASSPWRFGQKVMARMKKKNNNKTFKRQLSGRENPARPNLSEDEGCGGNDNNSPLMNEPPVLIIPAKLVDEAKAAENDEYELSKNMIKSLLDGGGGGGGVEVAKETSKKASSTAADGISGSSSASSRSKKSSPSGGVKGRKIVSKKKKEKSQSKSEATFKVEKEGSEPRKDTRKERSAKPKTITEHQQYADPGVALDLSESDDDSIGQPIAGSHIPLDGSGRTQPSSRNKASGASEPSADVPCDSVEVVSTSLTPSAMFHRPPSHTTIMDQGSVQIFSPSSFEENSPPAVERIAIIGEAKNDDIPFHPLGGDGGSGADTCTRKGAPAVPVRLKYRSPQRTLPPPSGVQHRKNSSSSNQHSPSSHDSPDSRLSSTGGSPASRISSSNSRASAATGSSTINSGDRTINTLHSAEDGSSLVVDGTDYEVREANRRSMRDRQIIGGVDRGMSGEASGTHPEVIGNPDGNDTVFSSSTTSSTSYYHSSYLQSPRPLRDGATMPVERFFAGGNVAMSPSPQRGAGGTIVYPAAMVGAESNASSATTAGGGPQISKFIALSPKKLSRVAASSGTGSPHTVSSNSVSANSSSSGSETKKPLKFVAYEIREEEQRRGELSSPFDEPPDAGRYAAAGGGARDAISANPPSSLIKPRISNQQSQRVRPPIQRGQKPPQSPRKQDNGAPAIATHGRMSAGARTPTRTPPPSSYSRESMSSSGANTPCSPPVIVDGPINNVALCGNLSIKPTRRYVGGRSSAGATGGGWRGMHLIPPSAASSSYRPQPQQSYPPMPPQPSSLRDNLTVVSGGNLMSGANDGAQEIIFTIADAGGERGAGADGAALVSPTSISLARKLPMPPKPELKQMPNNKGGTTAVVSPEKGF